MQDSVSEVLEFNPNLLYIPGKMTSSISFFLSILFEISLNQSNDIVSENTAQILIRTLAILCHFDT